jgi:cytidylate kinase
MTIDRNLLAKQNAVTSNALIDHLGSSEAFVFLASKEQESTISRDNEDAVKLEKGIEFAKSKGVLDANFVAQPYVEIDVLGKNPSMVADEILGKLKADSTNADDDKNVGSVIVLCGLSGTGKGTTVIMLRQKLENDEGEQVVTWSNGNIFRSVTLLAVTWCEQQADLDGFDKEKALTKENLEMFMGMLSFGKFNGKYDTHIQGLGLDMYISEVQNTELKVPKVSKNIPTVAEVTQGEVVKFAAEAVDTMGKDGLFVLLEGREQTVDFVRTPYRFTLTLSDESLIGKRRAAQRVMAAALKETSDSSTDEQVDKAVHECLLEMANEAGYA